MPFIVEKCIFIYKLYIEFIKFSVSTVSSVDTT